MRGVGIYIGADCLKKYGDVLEDVFISLPSTKSHTTPPNYIYYGG